ncbi:kinase-like protein, partial [Dissoconium aciculare CBS 342.82]|uniref:Kinase-like protein n=1 Tax=Dissoconium aciculare CBS 342.82 TaxID=1314786 RepID=A0A6J3LUE8_9PEZI
MPSTIDSEQLDDAENPTNRRPITSLPRAQTFQRQESEKREKLVQVEEPAHERRRPSVEKRDRATSLNALTPPVSPDQLNVSLPTSSILSESSPSALAQVCDPEENRSVSSSSRSRPQDLPTLQIPQMNSPGPPPLEANAEKPAYKEPEISVLYEEFQKRWLLNMSMNFRDRSCREKFFVTFAEKPNVWRRVTVSVDYRHAPLDSLEDQVNKLETQNDKSFRIFRAVHESLPQIHYFETVTNLRIETTPHDMQLHIHVREDANEVVEFPSTSMFRHIGCPRLCEASLEFDSHLAGFVYKVKSRNRFLIKKEIPGPDAIEEFLYEVNALDALRGSDNVIRMEGLVTDDRGECVKGLLLSYANQGALLDILWDHSRKTRIPWHRREKWAKQIVHGLSEIHEAGFVQGDFTLSNIVVDHTDTARIIDINRRGCPIGWEPPEFEELLRSGQRLNMAIGVKTDLFQLGMVLWALAEHTDEPENVPRPLREAMNAPPYFREIIRTCLSFRPQDRAGANILVDRFPE